jgi:hypothetical protein
MPSEDDDKLLPFSLPSIRRKKVTAAFDGGRISSDGGVLLLAGADRQLGLIDTLAAIIPDHRNPAQITHTMSDILRARMFAIARGYPPDATVSVLEQDFRTVEYDHIGKFNLFFYDGPHEAKDQYDGVLMALLALDDHAVLMVDDWNWRHVREATMNALRDGGFHIDFAIEIRTTLDNSVPTFAFGQSEWHNGLFAAAISKSP